MGVRERLLEWIQQAKVMRQVFFIFFVWTAIFSGTTFAVEPENTYPINFKRYSKSIASAGQLHDRHIPFIERENYSLVVYLAFDSSEDKSRLGIDKLIRGTGARLSLIHI